MFSLAEWPNETTGHIFLIVVAARKGLLVSRFAERQVLGGVSLVCGFGSFLILWVQSCEGPAFWATTPVGPKREHREERGEPRTNIMGHQDCNSTFEQGVLSNGNGTVKSRQVASCDTDTQTVSSQNNENVTPRRWHREHATNIGQQMSQQDILRKSWRLKLSRRRFQRIEGFQ
jgi:hypothetical protein